MENLETILNLSWEKRTCYKKLKEKWTYEKPYIGQSAVTSLIVNDLFGGYIMKVKVNGESHYYNVVEGNIIDYTAKQYEDGLINYAEGKLAYRGRILQDYDTKSRYYILVQNVKHNIELFNEEESHKRETKIHELKLNEWGED